MNKSIFIGRMATDPKVMSSAGKKTVAYFRIAVERKFRQEGAPNADYFSCVTFGERAEFVAKYFYKGKKIALEGEMHNDNYTGNSGEKVYGMRLLVTDIEFVDSKDESENVSQNGRTNRNSSQSSRNSGSNNNGRSSQNPGNSYQNSPYYKNTNQGKTNCTGSRVCLMVPKKAAFGNSLARHLGKRICVTLQSGVCLQQKTGSSGWMPCTSIRMKRWRKWSLSFPFFQSRIRYGRG